MAKPTKITNRITDLRATRGISQAELGQRVGVTRQTVNAIEGGKYSPSLEVAFKIARTLDVPLESVFDYPDEPRTTGPGPRFEARE
ncbi:MAG TPA: transcriptional regulator [Actinobacteria bacterium]|nr:transcriptional regulator [Actinomycetota bacterium]